MAFVKCPACDGYGQRERPAWMASGIGPVPCVSCAGRGVLVEVDTPPQITVAPPPITIGPPPVTPWSPPLFPPPWIDPTIGSPSARWFDFGAMPGVYG